MTRSVWGRYPEAVQNYSDAIGALEQLETKDPKGRNFAILYGNRAECHLKLGTTLSLVVMLWKVCPTMVIGTR